MDRVRYRDVCAAAQEGEFYWMDEWFVGMTPVYFFNESFFLPCSSNPLSYHTIVEVFGEVRHLDNPPLRGDRDELGLDVPIRGEGWTRTGWVREVLPCYKDGLTNFELATFLGINPSHTSSIFTQLYRHGETFRTGVRRRSESSGAYRGPLVNYAETFRHMYNEPQFHSQYEDEHPDAVPANEGVQGTAVNLMDVIDRLQAGAEPEQAVDTESRLRRRPRRTPAPEPEAAPAIPEPDSDIGFDRGEVSIHDET